MRKHALPLLFAATVTVAAGQTLRTLVNFTGLNGSQPSGRLVQGLDGNLYGITAQGGESCCGTVFRLTPGGQLTTLLSFNGGNGSSPYGGLTLATDGQFYGTTSGGSGPYFFGSVFRMTSDGTLTSLYGFTDTGDGTAPYMPLVEAADGGFYGSTTWGNGSGGTIFAISAEGSLTTLVGFAPDYGACNSLMQSPDGMFYGTTSEGGAYRIGSFFKMTPTGTLTAVFNFGDTPGNGPVGVVAALDGNFYGTTDYGPGAGRGDGIIFKVTPDGSLTSLHNFNSEQGYRPGGLIVASDGNFYGTTAAGGDNGLGTIYRMTPQGLVTTLHSFSDADGGSPPSADLFQATDGKFYGVTSSYSLDGTVFSFSVGLRPFVAALPHFGTTGAAIRILGTNLAGATRVSFNGRAARFTTVSATEIQTTVPAGAATGWIEVTTPGGLLLSRGPFVVRP